LHTISGELIGQLQRTPSAKLEARFAGAGKDGTPACATVKLLDGGWRLAA
jgi:hypothetical protein